MTIAIFVVHLIHSSKCLSFKRCHKLFRPTRLLNLFEAARKSSLLHQELWVLAGKD